VRIAMISTPFVPVPPPRYGGTELVVSGLCRGLAMRGHQVTLFSCGGARATHERIELRALYDRAQWPPDTRVELDHASWAIASMLGDERGFDLVHAHLPSALALAPLTDVPMVYTMHHERAPELAPMYRRLERHARFVAISARQRELTGVGDARVIHHGIEAEHYPTGDGAGGYAAFLGRFSPEKGAHVAIDAARAAGVPLRLAGRPHWHDDEYFRSEVQPRLDAGARTVGEVGGLAKARFLGRALALLFPIAWEEPFGLVMIEAMACGTPVLAFARGSVPEVIDDGVTGFVCDDGHALAGRLAQLARGGFDRRRCRARALERFAAARMVDEHLALYRSLTKECDERVPATLGA
jgi:glycosyltransferase involved in cell wall biosynthesis